VMTSKVTTYTEGAGFVPFYVVLSIKNLTDMIAKIKAQGRLHPEDESLTTGVFRSYVDLSPAVADDKSGEAQAFSYNLHAGKLGEEA